MPGFSRFEQPLRKTAVWLAIGLPLALLLYLLRFRVMGLPTTGLELYLFVLLAITTLIIGWRGWKEAALTHPWRWALLAWNAVGLCAAFYSPSVLSGLGLWRAYFLEPTLIALILPVLLRDESARARLKQMLCLTVLLISGWAFIQFVTGWGIPKPWNVSIAAGRRSTGPFPFPNAIALFLAPIVAWLSAQFIAGRRNRLEIAAIIAGFLAIICAKSDGGVVAVLSVVIGALLFQRVGRWILLAGSALAATVLVLIPKLATIIWKTLSFQQWSGKVRLFIWKETWQMLKAHPWLGAGLGGYPTVFAPFHKAKFIEIFQYPHTILFNLWTEVGVLGILAFIWLCILWIKTAKTHQSTWAWRWAAIAPLTAMLVQGLVDVPYFKNDLALLFWILAFLVTISSRI